MYGRGPGLFYERSTGLRCRSVYGWLMHGRNLHVRPERCSYAHVVATPTLGQKSPVLPGSPHEKGPNHCFGLVAPLLGPKLA